ncbi:hypothetical protein BGW36DRAFT_360982 [Talaromyces proteolyticus]|uniref:Anaphase-promoting complex subunit 11 n=1 Tax=Talaromyces proteolyticus TaxID=1131652 RepID=A0AAD4PYL3_9EURO|nr:uncharacterized protein BGW36DRAFT_360982 [Talaromyces proteolyticus]KAH8695278.1 hypothetical protein BGW36DRAFT_360982 [Talaromyces proteolyticus]
MAQTSQSCSLSHILEVWPNEDLECVGFATSKGRRCTVHTNPRNRRNAQILMREGTDRLSNGEECIDEILNQLAPLTLCVRFHQKDAPDKAREWAEKVRKFVQRRSTASTTRPREHSSTTRQSTPTAERQNQSNQIIQVNIQQNYYNLYTCSGRETESGTQSRRTTTSHYSPASISLTTPSTASSAVSTQYVRPGRLTQNRNVITPVHSERTITPIRLALPTSSPTPGRATTPTQQSSTFPRRRTTNIRQPVEGECGICYNSLLGDNESEEDDGLSDDLDSESVASTPTGNRKESLVWCRAQCGQNYHKECMDLWAASCTNNLRPATCPMCRAQWRQ